MINITYPELLRILYGLKESNSLKEHYCAIIGGVHGCGKTTLTERLKKDLPSIDVLSASTLIGWENIRKSVDNISNNQSILLTNYLSLESKSQITLIDGHYSLMKANGEIEFVGEQIFKALSPSILFLVESSVNIIQQRLRERDNIEYSLCLISDWIEIERACALYLAELLSIPLYRIKLEYN